MTTTLYYCLHAIALYLQLLKRQLWYILLLDNFSISNFSRQIAGTTQFVSITQPCLTVCLRHYSGLEFWKLIFNCILLKFRPLVPIIFVANRTIDGEQCPITWLRKTLRRTGDPTLSLANALCVGEQTRPDGENCRQNSQTVMLLYKKALTISKI